MYCPEFAIFWQQNLHKEKVLLFSYNFHPFFGYLAVCNANGLDP
jgi:hypothetical protein